MSRIFPLLVLAVLVSHSARASSNDSVFAPACKQAIISNLRQGKAPAIDIINFRIGESKEVKGSTPKVWLIAISADLVPREAKDVVARADYVCVSNYKETHISVRESFSAKYSKSPTLSPPPIVSKSTRIYSFKPPITQEQSVSNVKDDQSENVRIVKPFKALEDACSKELRIWMNGDFAANSQILDARFGKIKEKARPNGTISWLAQYFAHVSPPVPYKFSENGEYVCLHTSDDVNLVVTLKDYVEHYGKSPW